MKITADGLIIEIAAAQHGAFSREQAIRAGVSNSAIDRRVRSGWLTRRCRGVFTFPALEDRYTGFALATLSVPASALAGASAARLNRFEVSRSPLARDAAIEIVSDASSSDESPFAIVHRSVHLPEQDLTIVEGLRVTTPARTLCDLAWRLPGTSLVDLTEKQLLHRTVDEDDLITCFESWSGRGVKGSVKMRETLAAVLDDEPIPDSELELLAVRRMREHGTPWAQRQFQPPWYDGVRGLVDFAWPEAKVILEVDGRRFHLATRSKEDDERRDLLAIEQGWVVIRVGWHTLKNRPTEFLRRLAAIVASRSALAA